MVTTVTTSTSWFSRLGTSVKNILFGLLLVIGSIVLLFWNEGRAVKTDQSLKEGASAVISVSSEKKDPANEGKLIHFSGLARTPSVLTDVDFGVGGSALKLHRIVEVYQWKENTTSNTVEKLGGGTETTTTYSYDKDWSDNLIGSSSFKEAEAHQNPTSKRFEDKEWIAQNVNVGVYTISEDLLNSLSGYQPLTLTQEMFATLPSTTQEQLKLVGNIIYFQTSDATLPEIGNNRIHYESIAPQVISIIAKQSGAALVPYETKNGRTISMIQTGDETAKEMFAGAVANNQMMTWILRFLGMILMFSGFKMILELLPVVASVIPFIGRILGAGVSLVCALLTLIVSTITIAVAWITYRPLVGIILLLLAGLGYVFLMRTSKKASTKP
jgi:hypothetical protein